MRFYTDNSIIPELITININYEYIFIMPRPRRFRRVRFQPRFTFFRPDGIKKVELDKSILTVDEFEAIRLKDFENLEQKKAAKKMNISQPTFHRLILSARKKIADALVSGKAIKIEGGVYEMVIPGRGGGRGPGAGFGRGRGGRGRMGGPFAAGPGGFCICSNTQCGYKIPHIAGQPCTQRKCLKCGSTMIRER